MDARTALETCESALRQLMSYVYSTRFGHEWLDAISNASQRRTWTHRAEAEAKTRPGVSVLPPTGLAYSDFADLVVIARKHWDPLEPALGAKAETLPLLERFEELRNSVAHSRGVLVFEEDLLSGIAGQIRNQVTIFMSSQDQSGDYYPRIEFVFDSFGNRVDPAPNPAPNAICDGISRTEEVIHVGDTVTFTCAGTDPQDRMLEWKLSAIGIRETKVRARSGETVTLTWRAATTSENCEVQIHLNSVGDYHRRWSHDGLVLFTYRVVPPRPRSS